MKNICKTICCGVALLPGVAQAEVKLGGEAVFGYGEVDGDGQEYGILNLTLSDKYEFQSGISLKWDLRGRAWSDQDALGDIDDENFDGSVEIDFGAGGQLGFSTYNNIDQYPWADGELYDRGSVGVFPVIRKRYDGVADTVFKAGFPPPTSEKVDPDLLVTYSNRLGPVGIDLIANALGTWDGYEESELLDVPTKVEGKLTLPTDYGIYSVAYNDLDDTELQIVYPLRELGVTLIGRHASGEGDWDDTRTNLAVMYRAKNLGFFKGFMLAHAYDDTAERSMLNLNFGGEQWGVKIAGDTDDDLAIEGNFDIDDKSSVLFGWDNGHDMMSGFDDAVFPAPVFAAPRGDAFEVAFVHKF